MRLPADLSHAIPKEIEKTDRAELAKAAAELMSSYRSERPSTAITTPAHRAAYLAVRVPATFAANHHVFAELRRLAPEAEITSMLDLGAGPGTALYGAAEVFPELARATMIDADGPVVHLGQRLGQQSSHAAIRAATWLRQDLKASLRLEPHDLVVISYALNELTKAAAERTVLQAWECARQFLAIIEPGTVRGFGFVNQARSHLIAAGGHILAPCPHALECPMAAAGDWCHFAQRVERTAIHRQLKAGALGHEDEKFSYVVASRNQSPPAAARIVRHPQKHSGHVQLTLCTPQGLEKRTITKSQKEAYRRARKAEWGEQWG